MARQFFGTDGIRGRVNQKPMTVETALRLAIAAARTFAPDGGREVIIGRDTRRSGEMIEAALIAGLSSMGLTPVRIGVVPTPAVAMMTRETGAAFGVMVTASHNKYTDNGLKLFSPEGLKFTDEVEEQLEEAMFDAFEGAYAAPGRVALPRDMAGAGGQYLGRCLDTIGQHTDFSKLKIVLDCANGAAFDVGPQALQRLGADVTVIGAAPDGLNINAAVGSTDTKALTAAVLERKADIGIAFGQRRGGARCNPAAVGDQDRLVTALGAQALRRTGNRGI